MGGENFVTHDAASNPRDLRARVFRRRALRRELIGEPMRIISTRRLVTPRGTIDGATLSKVADVVRVLLGLQPRSVGRRGTVRRTGCLVGKDLGDVVRHPETGTCTTFAPWLLRRASRTWADRGLGAIDLAIPHLVCPILAPRRPSARATRT